MVIWFADWMLRSGQRTDVLALSFTIGNSYSTHAKVLSCRHLSIDIINEFCLVALCSTDRLSEIRMAIEHIRILHVSVYGASCLPDYIVSEEEGENRSPRITQCRRGIYSRVLP